MQEEKDNQEQAEETQPAAEEPAAEQPRAEEPPAEQPPAEEAPAAEGAEEPAAQADEPPPDEAPADEAAEAAPAPAAEAAPAEPAEPAEQLSPKERRKQARARTSGPAHPERSVEDRARERREERASKAAARTRWRAKRREKRRAIAGETVRAGTPQDVQAASGNRKLRQGVVVSSKGDKSITVRTDAVRRHRVYGKVVRETNTLHAHDETNQAGEGDIVRVMECRPISRTKRWRLVDVVEKAR
jgi:small subunit ribosomal protein S17